MPNEASGPPHLLRVVDFSNSPAGAQATQTLADFGAEVVHVEPPGGSELRHNPAYPFLGRGKRSIVVDLADDNGRAMPRQLAVGADVLVESFRPGVIERFELGYDAPLSLVFFMLLIALSKDGRWMQFSQVQPHLYMAMLGDLVEHEGRSSSRAENDDALAEVLAGVFATRRAQQWEDDLLAADVGCMVAHTEPVEVVLQSEEFAVAHDLLGEVDHPTFGVHPKLKPLVQYSRSATVNKPGVLCGQHTDAILTELGRDAAAIADLRERDIVGG